MEPWQKMCAAGAVTFMIAVIIHMFGTDLRLNKLEKQVSEMQAKKP